MADENELARNAYAVVCTGAVSQRADVIPFKTGDDIRLPIVLYVHVERERCERMVNRIRSRIAKVLQFDTADCEPSQPLLGVRGIHLKQPRKKVANGTEATATEPARRARRR